MTASPDWPSDPIAAVTHADPYPYYAHLVATRPFHRDEGLGFWVAAGVDAVDAVLASELCRVRPVAEPVPKAIARAAAGEVFGRLIRFDNGPGHCRIKPAMTTMLDALDPGQLAPAAEAHAAALIAKLRPQRDAAALDRFIATFAVQVVAVLLGLEAAQLADVSACIDSLAAAFNPFADPPAVARGHVAARRLLDMVGDLPGDAPHTLYGALTRHAHADRDRLVANGIGLLFQSYETTAGLIGNTLRALAENNVLGFTLAQEPDRVRDLVEAVLVLDPPTQNTRRFMAEDGVIAGQRLRAGDAILVLMAAAGREAAGAGPTDRPELSGPRHPMRNFGAGRHACPARQAATVIAEVAVRSLLQVGALPRRAVVSYRRTPNIRVPIFSATRETAARLDPSGTAFSERAARATMPTC
jgi:cytochrome P450